MSDRRDDLERDIRNWRGPIIPRGFLPDEDEPDPGDGCLACGEPVCDCDQRYDESREDER